MDNNSKKAGRKAKKIPDTAQIHLFDIGSGASKSETPMATDGDFLNPSPENIFFGGIKLRVYLDQCGLGWAIRLRELIMESDMTSLKSGYSASGRKAVHPAVMLGLIVYGAIEGKWSLRELELLASRDLGAMWICGGLRPDHSTIGNFINRFGDVLTEEYFIELTRMLLKKLKITPGDAAFDGTTMEAAANRFKFIKAEAARDAATEAEHKAKERGRDSSAGRAAVEAGRIADIAEDRLKRVIRQSRRNPGDLKINATDPEAVYQTIKNKTIRPSYKPSVAANSARMIVGKHVDSSDESASVRHLIDQHEAIFGVAPSRAMFDAGYHNMTVLSLAVEKELDILCPAGRADGGEWEKKLRSGKFDKTNFVYDCEKDVYTCPAGKELKRLQSRLKHGMKTTIYGCDDCAGCGLRGDCTDSGRGRTIERYEVDELKESMAKVFENERARRIYGQRKAMVEPVFSELKTRQNLNRFHRRGLAKVGVEFGFHCIAYNLKRAIRLEAVALMRLIFEGIGAGYRLLGFEFRVMIFSETIS